MINDKELTLILIKPDGLKLSNTGHIIDQMSHESLEIIASKIVTPTAELAEKHYFEHVDRPYFRSLISYLTGHLNAMQRVMALVYYGKDAVSIIRHKMGPTNPIAAKEDEASRTSIRAKYGYKAPIKGPDGKVLMVDGEPVEQFFNVVHGSDSVKTAEYEIKLWFEPEEIAALRRDEIMRPGTGYETKEVIRRDFLPDGKVHSERKSLVWQVPAEDVLPELRKIKGL